MHSIFTINTHEFNLSKLTKIPNNSLMPGMYKNIILSGIPNLNQVIISKTHKITAPIFQPLNIKNRIIIMRESQHTFPQIPHIPQLNAPFPGCT